MNENNVDPEFIYNFDETGVNYENLPSKIWLPQGTKNYKVDTAGNINRRVTVGLAWTANGEKLEP